jgi:muramoyltetrapeptide carboxypeptidase
MHTTILPQPLSSSDEIRIIAPASAVEKEYIDKTAKSLIDLGFNVSMGKYTMDRFHQFAGKDWQRAEDFQEAINDPAVGAIFCARGGYGSVRIIPKIDFSELLEKPKWLAGFSDITVFHSFLNRTLNIATIHAPMPVNVDNVHFAENLLKLKKILKGDKPEIKLNPHDQNLKGIGRGKLVGGNLSIIYSLQSTRFELDTRGNILFIEDVGEQLYHIDRMMQNLLLSGKLEELAGLVVGEMTDMKDKKRPFGQNAYEIINDAVKCFDFPVAFGFPAGHTDNNVPFLLGSEVELQVDESGAHLRYI